MIPSPGADKDLPGRWLCEFTQWALVLELPNQRDASRAQHVGHGGKDFGFRIRHFGHGLHQVEEGDRQRQRSIAFQPARGLDVLQGREFGHRRLVVMSQILDFRQMQVRCVHRRPSRIRTDCTWRASGLSGTVML